MRLATQVALIIISTAALAPMAHAQISPAEKAAIEEAKVKAAGRDVSVKVTTKKQSNNPDMKDAVTTTTSEARTPNPPVTQGAPNLPVLDETQYQPMVDADSSLVYISGGIGEAEIAYFKTLRDRYSLKLVMANKSGAFVSDATVAISNAVGEKVAVLEGVGPYLLVKLPAGKYTLTISAGDVEIGQGVTIREGKTTALDVRL